MRKSIVSLIIVVSLLFAVFASGCSQTPDSGKSAVCLVIANTANSQGLNTDSQNLRDTLYSVIRNYGYISVVNVDGDPQVVYANSYDIDDRYKSASADKLDSDAKIKTDNLLDAVHTLVADDPETDYLKALSLASRSLSSLTGYDSKKIIVIGTGLSTSGILNFRNNLLAAEPEVIVEILNEQEAIPDFTGMSVTWQQIGDVAAPQQELTSRQMNRLISIYEGIVTAGNGLFSYDSTIGTAVDTGVDYPSVSLVDLPSETPMVFEYENTSVISDDQFSEPVVLSEDQVAFIEDSAEYLNPDQALEVLSPVAQWLIEHYDVTILLVGTTAGDTNSDYALSLSLDRANAVRDTLIDLGADPSQILTIGLGSSDPWHVYGLGFGEEASVNRKVVIIDASSDLAMELLG